MKQDSKNNNPDDILQEKSPYASSEEKRFLQEFMSLAEIGVFIKKDSVCVRAFSLTNSTTVLAYVLAEMNDFFMLAFPSTVFTDRLGRVEVKQISVVPMIKMYKNMVNIAVLPPAQVMYQYLYGTRDKLSSFRGYFNNNRASQVSGLIEALKIEYDYKDPVLVTDREVDGKDDKESVLKELAKSLRKPAESEHDFEKDLYVPGKNKRTRYRH